MGMGTGTGVQLEESVGSRTIDEIITKAARHLMDRQEPDGYWSECFDTGVMADAQTLISLALLGISDPDWAEPLLLRIRSHQRWDGSWGVHPEDEGDLSTTVECYYALTLYQRWPTFDAERQTRSYILSHGGLTRYRNLTRIFLAVGGEIPWSWLPSPRLYSWLFGRRSPVRIWDIVTFTRLHVAPMLLLSAMRYVACDVPVRLLAGLVSNPTALSEVNERRNRPGLSHGTLRRMFRCLKWMLEEREADGTAAGYHSSSFLLLFVLRAFEYPLNHPQVSTVLASMRRNLRLDWATGEGHQQTCNANVWNTAIALQGASAAGIPIDDLRIRRSASYLIRRQHRSIGTWVLKNPCRPGGWAFSDNNSTHPDNDDTVACLEALYPFRNEFRDAWWGGVHWLLGMQNRDGGWSAFEKDCAKNWLEWIPANDMKRAMTDPSTPDMTGRVVAFLLRHQILPPEHLQVQRAIRWLCQRQEADGTWFGRWGTTYIYGTWCVVKALVTVDSVQTRQSLRWAKNWFLSIQQPDGSFGESCNSDRHGRYLGVTRGTPTQTAWALDALLDLYEFEVEQRERIRLLDGADLAATWLIEQATEDGTWMETVPTGSAFPGSLHIRYEVYPKVWPLIALCHFRAVDRTRTEGR